MQSFKECPFPYTPSILLRERSVDMYLFLVVVKSRGRLEALLEKATAN